MPDKETLREFLLKEVDLIQEIVKRMAFNSFMIKGWTLTLVVASLLLRGTKGTGTESQVWADFIAFIPLLVFWFLDAYFLWQERMYRKLYEWVVANRLATDEFLLDLNAYRFKEEVQSRFRIMFSTTLGWFYGAIAVLIVIYALRLFLTKGGC